MGRNNSPVIGDNGYNLEVGDNTKFIKHALAHRNLPPIDIRDVTQVEERITWYFNHCVEDDIKPTVAGLCNSLGISRETLHNWKSGEYREQTHQQVILNAYKFLDELWEHYMMNGKINPVAGIFIGKTMYGHIEEQHINIQAKPLEQSQDISYIEAKYKELPED